MRTLAFLLLAGAGVARADTAATCRGTIESVPTVISQQGTWCLAHDVATSVTTGAAITVETNNVTIDCNGYKIGGLGAGPATQTSGIYVDGHLNTVVRNCSLRGFRFGIAMVGGGGRLVERNRIEGSTLVGVYLQGDGSLLRDNQIIGTGPSTGHAWGVVIGGSVDVLGNTVSGVTPYTASGSWVGYGLSIPSNPGSRVQGNIFRGIADGGGGSVVILVNNTSNDVVIQGNQLLYSGTHPLSFGIACQDGGAFALAAGNTLLRFKQPRFGCVDGGGNDEVPAP